MRYEGSLYRPPSEAYSLIIQATIGCTHNGCTFCSMYKDKTFRIRPTQDIIEDLKVGRARYKNVSRIFIADGDALAIENKKLEEILSFIKENFPECQRIGIYGSPRAIASKSHGDLIKLKKLGLGIIYLGVESGSDMILKKINKGVTSREMVLAGKKVINAGIKLSVTLISGIGGKEDTYKHARESARIINEINPHYIGLLTLIVEENTPLYADVKSGKFELLSAQEVLFETRIIVENIDVDDCIFRSNHVSNYVSLKGTLPMDKYLIIDQINEALKLTGLESKDLYRRL